MVLASVNSDDIRKVRVGDLQLLYVAISKVPTSPVTLLVSHWLSIPSLQGPVGSTSLITRLATNLHLLENSSLDFIEELIIYHGYDTFRQARMLKKEGNVIVAEPPKCLGPPTPAIVLRTSDGDVGSPPTLEVR